MKKKVKEGMFWGAVIGLSLGIINIPSTMIHDCLGIIKAPMRPLTQPIVGLVLGIICGGSASAFEEKYEIKVTRKS